MAPWPLPRACPDNAAKPYAIFAATALNVVLTCCFPLLGLHAGSGRRPAAAPP